MSARTTRELSEFTDQELSDLQDELTEKLSDLKIESDRVANLRYERNIGLRKRKP